MEYTLTYSLEDDPKSFSYTLVLTTDQLRGIVTFMFMYLYDRYNETTGELDHAEFERMYNTMKGRDRFTEFTVTSADGPEDIWELDYDSAAIPNLLDNKWARKRRGQVIQVIIHVIRNRIMNTYDDVQYQISDLYKFIVDKDGEHVINRRFPPNQLIPETKYKAVFASKNTLAYKGFTNLEYLQGFMSMATWLGLDYNDYIAAIFENQQPVMIA